MEIIQGTDQLPPSLQAPIVAVGNFDGVHIGHRSILKKIVARVKEKGGVSVVYTFEPHPLQILCPGRLEGLLASSSEKMRIFEQLGIQFAVCEPFTKSFSENSPEKFIRDFLYRRLKAQEVYVGQNFAFGKGRAGTTEDLRRIGDTFGIQVVIEKPVLYGGSPVSSSRIRGLLREGKVEEASVLLGRPYLLEGEVAVGERRGRTLGYGTANLVSQGQIVPKEGIYAVRAEHGGRLLDGVGYIGASPTFGENSIKVEVHLFKVHEDLYRDRMRVYFVAWIREDKKFEAKEDLIRQIKKDIRQAEEVLKKIGKESPLETYETEELRYPS